MSDDRPGNPQVLLRIPDELGPRLLRDAIDGETTVQAVILGVLANHYGVTVEPPKRGWKKGLARKPETKATPKKKRRSK